MGPAWWVGQQAFARDIRLVIFRPIDASIPPMRDEPESIADPTPDRTSDTPLRWSVAALAGGDERVLSQAAAEAQQLARALAARAVAAAPDAEVSEYADRLRTLTRSIWPSDPLEGYGLHSSLGAFLVARVAMGWAPPTDTRLRDEPLDAAGVRDQLVEHGVPAPAVAAIMAEWAGVEDGFTPDPNGLPAAQHAGLAEGTLSIRERADVLCQLAFSPRCLARAAVTITSVTSVRQVLPVLPREDDELGGVYVSAMAAIALGRPDRALALLGLSPQGEAQTALAELARAQWNLERGEPAQLLEDDDIGVVELDSNRPAPAPAAVDDEDDEDDVLEIVEEVVRAGAESDPTVTPAQALPQPPRWTRPDWAPVELDETFVRLWRQGRDRRRATFGHLQSMLGMEGAFSYRALPATPIPPDARTLRRILDERSEPPEPSTAETERIDVTAFIQEQQEKLGLGSCEPVFPVVRAAVRAVAAAAEGDPPTEAAIAAAGDLEWVLRRSRALALAVRGDLDAATEAVQALGKVGAAEVMWTQARMMRFAGRPAAPVEPAAARRAAARIVSDLAVQLGRTVAGTVI